MKESQLLKAIKARLNGYERVHWIVFQRNNTGAMKTRKKIRDRYGIIRGEKDSKTFFGKTGSPDFYIFFDGGVIHLELKGEGGEQRFWQKEWEDRIDKLSRNYYYLVSNLAEFENIINYHQIEKTK